MKKVLTLWMFLFLYSVSPALAQGPYLGGGFVYNNPLGSDINYLRPGPGLNFRFGYDFGPVALEGNLVASRHADTDPGYGHADLGGFNIDLRVFLSPENARNLVYLVAGIGSYSLYEYDPFLQADTQLNGNSWNAGAGLEHFLDSNLALNLALQYRSIRYDEFEIDNTLYSLRPRESGDVLALELGVNYHF
jgi:hypothetical protein